MLNESYNIFKNKGTHYWIFVRLYREVDILFGDANNVRLHPQQFNQSRERYVLLLSFQASRGSRVYITAISPANLHKTSVRHRLSSKLHITHWYL